MRCTGCHVVIPDDATYARRTFTVERLVFCTRRCFDEHAPAIVRTLLTVMRHIATNPRSRFRHAASMALSSPMKEVPLL